CPQAWRPKLNHHTLTGSRVADCCEKSCELFTCTGVYRSNEAYWGNVGDSPQVCCDKMCGSDFECDRGYVLADATAAGVTKEDCCKPKCELFTCTAPWAPSAAKKDVVSSTAEDCCDQTCAAVNCSVPGWTANESKALIVGNTVEDCCAPLCGNAEEIKCPQNFAVKPEDENKTGGTEVCCHKQCKAHDCSPGWAPDDSKADDFADSDEACCVKTCKLFECPKKEGWAANELAASTIGDNETVCCSPTCKQFTCNATEGWLKDGTDKDDEVASEADKCCVPACSRYVCSAGHMPIPDAATVPGASNEVCCESKRCDTVRKNMTKLGDDEYCNGQTEEDCEKKFIKYTNKSEVKTAKGKVKTVKTTTIVACTYNTTYNLCRYDTARPIKGGCSGV
ncbi:unnamed protein product, partial [Symbiodinium natans]